MKREMIEKEPNPWLIAAVLRKLARCKSVFLSKCSLAPKCLAKKLVSLLLTMVEPDV